MRKRIRAIEGDSCVQIWCPGWESNPATPLSECGAQEPSTGGECAEPGDPSEDTLAGYVESRREGCKGQLPSGGAGNTTEAQHEHNADGFEEVAAAWPTLPAEVRAKVLAIVKAAGK